MVGKSEGAGGYIVFMAAMTMGISGVWGQTTKLEDIPTQGISPPNYDSLPLNPDTRQFIEAAVKSRDYIRAEQLLVKEIDLRPKSYILLASLGRVFFLDGKYLDCAIAIKKAERNLPLKDPDRYTLALAYVVLKRPDWARPEFERLEQSNPGSPLYLYWLGRLDYEAMRFKTAAAEFEKILAQDHTFMKAYDNLGLTYEALGDFDRAIRNYNRAVELNRQQSSPSPWPPLNLGTLLIRLGESSQAENALRESIQYDSRFPMAHFQLGRALEKEKKDGEALQELRQAVSFEPEYPEPHFVLARIYRRTGEVELAESELKTFQKLKQKYPHMRVH